MQFIKSRDQIILENAKGLKEETFNGKRVSYLDKDKEFYVALDETDFPLYTISQQVAIASAVTQMGRYGYEVFNYRRNNDDANTFMGIPDKVYNKYISACRELKKMPEYFDKKIEAPVQQNADGSQENDEYFVQSYPCFVGETEGKIEFYIYKNVTMSRFVGMSVNDKATTEMKYDGYMPVGSDKVRIKKAASGDVSVYIEDLKKVISVLSEQGTEGARYSRLMTRSLELVAKRSGNIAAKIEKEAQTIKNIFRNTEDYEIVRGTMIAGMEDKRKEFIEYFYERDVESMEYLQAEMSKYNYSLYDYFYSKANSRSARIGASGKAMEYAKYFDGKKLKSDYKEIIRKECEQDVSMMQEAFIMKNGIKLATIVNNKGNLKNIDVITLDAGGETGFSGSFEAQFEDGSSFIMTTQIVFVWGEIQSTHYRFPTTFHNIKFVDGSFKKSLGEADMIEMFK